MRTAVTWAAIILMILPFTGAAYDYIGTVNGENTGDEYGSAVTTVDFNADGYPDLVVSAPAADDAGTSSGAVYIYYGGPAADTIADLKLVGTASSFFGKALASAGDFNNDTYEDLLVGAPFYDIPASSAGAVFLYYGGPNPDTVVDYIFTGEAASDYFGISVAGVGDFNNDTYADIAIGAYKADWGSFSNSGKVYIYYGGPSPDFTVDRILVGNNDGERFGYALAGADFSGDGFTDIAVGAYSYDDTYLNQGRIYVFYGGSSTDTVVDMTITGDSAGYKFGWSLASGRINNDSFFDLIMGTDGYSIDTFPTGKMYLYHGGSGFDAIADYSYSLERTQMDYLGFSVAGGVDINEDGAEDLLAGMPGNDDGASEAGGAVFFHGGASESVDTTVLGSSADEQMGKALGQWGWYGDAHTYVVIVGAPAYNSYTGRVHLYRIANGGTNNPPVLDPIGPKNTQENVQLLFTVSASDADGTIPALSASTLPTGAVFTDNLDGTGTFDWTPTYSQAGVYPVTFYASDGVDIDSELVQITVENVNRAPVLDPIGPKTTKAETLLSFTITASDPDGTIPSLSAVGLPTGASFTDSANGVGLFEWTPPLADTGQYGVIFIASDGSLSDSELVMITVTDTAGCCVNRGNVDGVIGGAGPVDVADLTYLVAFLFQGGAPPPCEEEGNVDSVVGGAGPIDVSDLTYLVAFLFQGGTAPPPC